MSDGSPVRRSFRLKDKPDPEYVYKNFLKKDYLPPAVVQINKKYDDLFSSVLTNAFLLDIQKTPDQYYAEKEAAAALKRAASSSESSDSDIICLDDDEDVSNPKKLKKMRKNEEKIEKNRQKSTQKTVKELERIVRKIESGVKKIEKKTAKTVKNRNSTSTSSSTSSDLEILEITPVKKFGCSCGKVYETHNDCHRHIFEEHTHHEDHCIHCGLSREDIRITNGCHVCSKFSPDLEQHLSQHYRNCTGRHAVMECRFCIKQFRTVREVIQHEKEKHTERAARKQSQVYKCNECSFESISQEVLLGHYGNWHVDLNELSNRINELQIKVQAEKEECPFCRITVASRKCFRAHMLRSHWPACKTLSQMSPDTLLLDTPETRAADLEIKKEIEELLEATAAITAAQKGAELLVEKGAEPILQKHTIKKEIKEEETHEDDGYGRGPSTSEL